MYKILYCVSTLGNTGPTNQLLSLIRNLDRSIFEPYLLTLSAEPPKSKWHEFEEAGVKLYSLNLSRIKFFFKAKNDLTKLLAQIKPNIFHTQGVRADCLAAKLTNSIPHVITAHNHPYEDFPLKYKMIIGKIMADFHIKAMKKSKTIACSKSVMNNLLTHEVKSISIQNGIDIDLFKPLQKSQINVLRKSLNLQENDKIFIAVGSLRKNMITIINAFYKLTSEQDCQLIILGSGPEYEHFKSITRDNEKISLMGNVNNVKEYLQSSDCFISASFSEGLPYSVLEAMAINLNCILSDIPSHREILNNSDSMNNQLFEPNNVDQLVELIRKELVNNIENNNRKIIVDNFDEKTMSKKYQNYYINLIEQIKQYS